MKNLIELTRAPARWLRDTARYRMHQQSRVANVCLIHMKRCGSTVLGNMLHRHVQIEWAGEYLGPLRKRNVESIASATIEQLASKVVRRAYRHPEANFGFELTPRHVRGMQGDDRLVPLVTALHKRGFSHFILLERRSYLRRTVSQLQFAETGTRHSSNSRGGPVPVRVDVSRAPMFDDFLPLLDVYASLDQRYAAILEWSQCLPADRFLHLTYEQDIENDPTIAYRRVCGFLQVEPSADERPDLGRTNPHQARDVIENFDEVAQALTGTKYEWMLHT